MKYSIAALFAILVMASAFAGDDPNMVVMSMEIHSNGKMLSTPMIAFEAEETEADASVMQSVDVPGTDEDLALELTFHTVHVHERGPEMLMDIDSGLIGSEHVEARHMQLAWNEPYEFAFSVSPDAPAFRVMITPSRATLSEFMRGRQDSD
ncbi:MAG TPA: hypothetical protein VF275_12315 [Gammaproteobacteria bacterium]